MREALVGFFAATLRISTPLLLGGLGEMVIEKSGVLNLGIEGTMLLSAFTGFLTIHFTHSPWPGLLIAMLTGVLMGLLLGGLTVSLGLRQHVCGLGITILATALALYLYRVVFGTPPIPPRTETFQPLELGGIFRQYLLTYIAFALVGLLHFLFTKTPFGLRLKAVGANPKALDAAGVSVHLLRYKALALGGALIGAGGAFLSTAQLGFFQEGIVSGRGWVALALVTFGNWNPSGVLAGALLFSGIEAAQMRTQTLGVNLPHEIFSLAPYLLTVLALAFLRRRKAPLALLEPYPKREEEI